MPPTILFIDDDLSLLEAMRRSLSHEQMRVLCAVTVEEARVQIESSEPDVIVCDEGLPGTSGVEFLSEIRESHPAIMRVMLTGQISVGAAVRAINAGEVFRVLLKPCDKQTLMETIRHAVTQKAFLEQSRRSLALFRQQNDLLQRLEQQHPGLIDEIANFDIGIKPAKVMVLSTESLVGEFEIEIARASGLHKVIPAEKPDTRSSPL